MAQPEFTMPDFLLNNSADDIHARMMNYLPADIDNLPGGFPYDFTRPAALEKDELINFHLVRAVMIAFPQYAWDEWLDLHGQQVGIKRHASGCASGYVKVSGATGTIISAGTIFCTPATDTGPSIEFYSYEEAEIGEDGTALIPITAVEAGISSNVASGTINLMSKPNKAVISVINEEPMSGGTERENNNDYYDRIAAEYDNSMTFLGNDSDYIRWAKEAGAGDCIVISAAHGPGTVELVLVDANGKPANDTLIKAVYNYIVSPDDRSARLLPTACSEFSCIAAKTVSIDFTITGLQFDETTDIETIKAEFALKVLSIYSTAKAEGILRYNDVRPLISVITGVEDFDTFLVNGSMDNINLSSEEYPETGTLNFS